MSKSKKNIVKRKHKTPLRVILTRVLAIILAVMMVVTLAYYLFPVFNMEFSQAADLIAANL